MRPLLLSRYCNDSHPEPPVLSIFWMLQQKSIWNCFPASTSVRHLLKYHVALLSDFDDCNWQRRCFPYIHKPTGTCESRSYAHKRRKSMMRLSQKTTNKRRPFLRSILQAQHRHSVNIPSRDIAILEAMTCPPKYTLWVKTGGTSYTSNSNFVICRPIFTNLSAINQEKICHEITDK